MKITGRWGRRYKEPLDNLMDKDTVIWRRKHQNALGGELALEEAGTSCKTRNRINERIAENIKKDYNTF